MDSFWIGVYKAGADMLDHSLTRCAALLLLLSIGCSATNPSFELSRREAKRELRAMQAEPIAPARPIIVLGGYLDPGLLTESLGGDLRDTLEGGSIVTVSFSMTADFDACYRRLMQTLEEEAPGVLGDPDTEMTEPVDVVAISMGGLVARYSALERGNEGKRLQIKRLFTISTPHQGATWAWMLSLNEKQTKMRPGSDWLDWLNTADADLPEEVYCYVRLRDSIVGSGRSAPPGETAWWVHTPLWQSPHLGAPGDPRIVADIARRLRGEPAYAKAPPSALP